MQKQNNQPVGMSGRNIEGMCDVYEAEIAKYQGGISYRPNNATAQVEAMKAALEYGGYTEREIVGLVAIRKALEAAPVYVTKDGTWLNFRPDADKQKGGAMIKIEGKESEAIRAFGEKLEAALDALSKIEENVRQG